MGKKEITEKLAEQSQLLFYGSNNREPNKAANRHKSLSKASISQILNGNWELIKDDMWRNIGSQIGLLIFIR